MDALEKKYRLELPATQQVGLRELAVGMFVQAWYPRVYFRLSFGAQDQVAKLLDPVARKHPLAVTFDQAGKQRLTKHLLLNCDEQSLKKLLRYVVQRLLRVFFQKELRGVKDALVDRTRPPREGSSSKILPRMELLPWVGGQVEAMNRPKAKKDARPHPGMNTDVFLAPYSHTSSHKKTRHQRRDGNR